MLRFKHYIKEQTNSDIKKFFEEAQNIKKTEGIVAAEENWQGSLADFGDSDAALKIVRMKGYFDYFSQLEELAFKYLGELFKVYRAMPNIDLEDIGRPIATTLNKRFAEKFANFVSQDEQQLVLVTLEAHPSSIVMLGKPEEQELVLEPQELRVVNSENL